MILFVADGVLIRRLPRGDQLIPSGALAYERDMYAAGFESCKPICIVFDVDAIIGELGKELDACGYTAAYHKALMEHKKSTQHVRSQADLDFTI